MNIALLHDKAVIYNFLKTTAEHQIYCIGDLDSFFWPATTWYALTAAGTIQSVALLYTGTETPAFLLFHTGDAFYAERLLQGLKQLLPQKFNAHLSPGLMAPFGSTNIIAYYGLSYKMVLRAKISAPDESNIRRLTQDDIPAIESLLSVAYPQNWFDRRMIATNKYFGYFHENQLAGIAGVHVYSEEYRVAALGNIATHPAFRGKKIASRLTAVLCHHLEKTTDIIGLNVRAENKAALQCYQALGFETIGAYDECYIKNDSTAQASS